MNSRTLSDTEILQQAMRANSMASNAMPLPSFPQIPNSNISYQPLSSCEQSNRGNRNIGFSYRNFGSPQSFMPQNFALQQKHFIGYLNAPIPGSIPQLQAPGQIIPSMASVPTAHKQLYRQGMAQAAHTESSSASSSRNSSPPTSNSSSQSASVQFRVSNGTPNSSPEIPDPTPSISPKKPGTQSAYQLLHKLYNEERESNARAKEQLNILLNENMAKDSRIEELETTIRSGKQGDRSVEAAEIQRLQSENESYKQKLQEIIQNTMRSPPNSRQCSDSIPSTTSDPPSDLALRYKAERDALQKGLTGAHNRLKALKSEIESGKTNLMQTEAKLREVEAARDEMLLQLRTKKEDEVTAKDLPNNPHTDSSGTEANMKKIKDENQSLKSATEQFSRNREAMEEKIAELTSSVERLSTENSELTSLSDKQKLAIENLQNLNEELQNLNWESEELEVTRKEKKDMEEKYNTVVTDLQDLKSKFSMKESSKAKEVADLQETISSMKEELEGMQLDNSKLLRELEQIGDSPGERKEAIERFNAMREEFSKLQQNLQAAEIETIELKNNNSDMREKVQELERKLDSKSRKLKEKNQLLQTEKTVKAKELKKFRDSLTAVQSRENELSSQLSCANQNLEKSEFRMMEMEKSLEAILKRKNSLFKEKQCNLREIARLKQVEDSLRKDLEALRENCTQSETDSGISSGESDDATKRKTIKQLKVNVNMWRDKCSEAETKIREIENKIHAQYSEKIGRLEENIRDLTAERNVLENENANFWKDSVLAERSARNNDCLSDNPGQEAMEGHKQEDVGSDSKHDQTGIQDDDEEILVHRNDSCSPYKRCRIDPEALPN